MSNAWFDETEEPKIADAVQSQASTLEASPYESDRRQSLLCDLELFLGTKLTSLYQLSGIDFVRAFGDDQQIAFNICYSITNTIRNRICSFRPRAQFLPDGGDFKARRAARNMTELSDGWAAREKYQDEASFAFRDILTGDGGVLKLYIDNERKTNDGGTTADIKIARFPSWEFFFDEAETVYREPECGYHIHYLPVEQAARRYQIDEKDLKSYVISQPQGVVYVSNREMVRIVDAYSRPTNDGPGKHSVVVGPKATTEDWEHDGPPFIIRGFDERPIGIWSDGVVKRLRSLQVELIEWQNSMRDAHYLNSQQVISVHENEEAPTKINNATIRIVRYRNTPAQVTNPPAASAEMYKYYETVKAAGYEILGVSQFIASGVKQPGINSAVAIRESSELQTDRLALVSQTWESMRVEAAEWWRRFAVQLVKEGKKLSYRAIRRGTFLEMTMEDAERDYEIRAFPSSLFGQTISGRLERATELVQAGWISRPEALKALDVPDLSPIIDLELSQAYAMEFLVDDILENGKYITPDPQIEPDTFYDYANKRYLLTISDGSNYPTQNLSELRKLLAYLKPKADKARAAKMAPAPGGDPSAGASPEQIEAEATPAGPGAMAA